MGKTWKDQANHYRFKDKRDEAPKHLRKKIDLMDAQLYNGSYTTGYRFGNNRKGSAKSKWQDRKIRRQKEKRMLET